METVIERANDLLQRLKAPCIYESDTSSSFHTPDSRESSGTVSTLSDVESFAEEAVVSESNPDLVENIETQLVVHDIYETGADSSRHCEQLVQCEREYADVRANTPTSAADEAVRHVAASSRSECRASRGKSHAQVTSAADQEIAGSSQEEKAAEALTESSSLEGWAMVAENALRECRDHATTHRVLPDRENAHAESRRDDAASSATINPDDGCDEAARKSRRHDVATVERNHFEESTVKMWTTAAERRSPSIALEEYARRCGVTIEYEYKSKPNVCVVNGDLCGFRAMSCAATEDQARNELAAKILWMIAEHQMNGSKLSSSIPGLSDLSRDEMLEIMAFDACKLKNASQRLYKFCLEKGESTPEYSVRRIRTNQGFTYATQCTALGHTGVGQGLRTDGAKNAAAENLYQNYNYEMQRQTM